MKILLIGTGRVALNLGHAIRDAGLEIVGVVGRDPIRTARLSDQFNTRSFQIEDEHPAADLILIAVTDDAIESVAQKIGGTNAVVAHTSGASSMDLLPQEHRAVMWPVQTFLTDAIVPLRDVPIIIEGRTDLALNVIEALSLVLSERTIALDHKKRQRLHLAAVFTSNFTVKLVHEAQRLLAEQGLSNDLLTPLWRTTAANVIAMGPEKALTGPARRGDQRTIEKHLDLLKEERDLQRLYQLISDLIQGK